MLDKLGCFIFLDNESPSFVCHVFFTFVLFCFLFFLSGTHSEVKREEYVYVCVSVVYIVSLTHLTCKLNIF